MKLTPFQEYFTTEQLQALSNTKYIYITTINTVRFKIKGRRVVKLTSKWLKIKCSDGTVSTFGLVSY